MALPEEDRGPAWLGDYGDIEADFTRMAEFAARLRAEVIDNYLPHLALVYDDMTVALPEVHQSFPELLTFLTTHQASQEVTRDNIHYIPNVADGFAAAAEEISSRYRDSDAFSSTRVAMVEQALNNAGVSGQPPVGTTESGVA